ncbi:MAG: tRNA (adenosine(37)-N6)-dimethylallyltransferase MiaA [bacterium]
MITKLLITKILITNPVIVIIVITGPTAIGKTNLSLLLAKSITNTLIVSVDSRQIYKLMDIGTDKVSKQIRKEIPHYLIDIINPNKDFSLWEFLNISKKITEFAIKKRKNLIFVGGTILYIRALIEGFNLLPTNPIIRKKYENLETQKLQENLLEIDKKFGTNFHTSIKDKRRMVRILEVYEITQKNPLELWKTKTPLPIDKIIILENHREKIYQNINNRVDKQIKQGLVDEVKFILKKFPEAAHFKSMKTFGYYETIQYITGKIDLQQTISLIKKNTRRFAKRQLTFLKKIIPLPMNIEIIKVYEFNENFNDIANHICQKLNY